MTQQCLSGRRIGLLDKLTDEAAAWAERTSSGARVLINNAESPRKIEPARCQDVLSHVSYYATTTYATTTIGYATK